jgi:hypothetical protein
VIPNKLTVFSLEVRSGPRTKDFSRFRFPGSEVGYWVLSPLTDGDRGKLWHGRQGFVLVGAIVFWRKEDMEVRDETFKGRKYNQIWYSFDLFVPIIQLEAASVWAPKPDKRRKCCICGFIGF